MVLSSSPQIHAFHKLGDDSRYLSSHEGCLAAKAEGTPSVSSPGWGRTVPLHDPSPLSASMHSHDALPPKQVPTACHRHGKGHPWPWVPELGRVGEWEIMEPSTYIHRRLQKKTKSKLSIPKQTLHWTPGNTAGIWWAYIQHPCQLQLNSNTFNPTFSAATRLRDSEHMQSACAQP